MDRPPPVATVCANPAIDLSVAVSDLSLGGVNRAHWHREDPGGKGINVAAGLAHAGLSVTVTGFLGTDTAAPFDALCAARGIRSRFVRLPGRCRTNIKLLDDRRKTAAPNARGTRADDLAVTEVNLPGFSVPPEAVSTLTETVTDLGREIGAAGGWMVLSGSLPDGVPADFYARLLPPLRKAGCRIALDTRGAPLDTALAGPVAPDLLKPNLDELADHLGHPLTDIPAVLAAVHTLHDRGVGVVVVSMGRAGAVLSDGREVLLAEPGPVEAHTTVGAGDAMVAGLVTALVAKATLSATACLATAFAMGAVTCPGPALPPMATIRAYADSLRISPLSQKN